MKGPYLPFDYPNDYTPLDIDRLFTIGRSTKDGTAVQLDLAQGGGYIVAGRGGGGTTMLHNLTASLARMPNVVIWHIDTNNGGLSAPWLLDENGELVIDWAAVTEDDALRMVKAAVRIARRRRAAYAAEMYRSNQTILPVRPGLPQIVILVDKDVDFESAVGRQLFEALAELRRIGRAMRVVAVAAYMRATADYMPTEDKKSAEFALVGRVCDVTEVAYALDWDKDLPVPIQRGQFVIRDRDGMDLFDAFRITPDTIRRVVAAVAQLRAETSLDDKSFQAAGVDYLERWRRPDTRMWLALVRGEEEPIMVDDLQKTYDQVYGSHPKVGVEIPEKIETLDDVIAAVKALLRRVKKNDEG